ncbi:tryptophanase [Nocardia panacis]|nr:tryptophanase [Nocardia panacis]
MFEPYRIKMVEPISITTPEHRRLALRKAGYNMFGLRAQDVTIDLLTDSGTGAMSQDQWAAVLYSDESYAGADSWFRFERRVRTMFGFRHVLPTHQGRAAERLLYTVLCVGKDPQRLVVPSNSHFDTGRGNLELLGVRAVNLPCAQAADLTDDAPFKGNADVAAMDRLITEVGAEFVPAIVMTVTNNTGGGQPVSMANIAEVSALARSHGIPMYLDGCRFAENAYFIQQREPEYESWTIPEIVSKMCSYAEGCTVSAKKDGLCNIGGFLATDDDEVAAEARQLGIITEGFYTYGGLSGRDLDAIAVGLKEVCEQPYLEHRVGSVRYLATALRDNGVPVVWPPGGHAVYIDAAALLPHIPPLRYPAQALCAEIYLEGGVRTVELGTCAFGYDALTGVEAPAQWELCRLALPRRVYTQSHLDYVIESLAAIAQRRDRIQGLRMTSPSTILRHFTAQFTPVLADDVDEEARTPELAGHEHGSTRLPLSGPPD